MPDAQHFLKGFGFVKGLVIDGFKLTNAQSTHNVIQRFQKYKYDITLEFVNTEHQPLQHLYQKIDTMISKEKIIYGVRNPYRCTIDSFNHALAHHDGTVVVHLTGHSVRIKKSDV